MPKLLARYVALPFTLAFFLAGTFAQRVSIGELNQTIKTYPFSDPNPVPVLGINKKVAPFYPYFVFDGYTDKPVNKGWKVVTLENDFISVSVLPEVGGKVMGAIEKASGNEFVYLNHVMKFRAIGIRGPWTSGGIEHNFGLDLGHAPWAAAAVDYVLKNNPDGSVSCIVGGLDLASRSEWRVNIRLPKDKAYFETESMWYNPSPLHHAYLSWENAAFRASNDLQFYFPGNYHIGHDGLASPWPIDKEGRNLAMYKENDFGESKSYHVVGNYRNWFGGYWHDKKFGFGHWAPYSEAPGKKLWIWSLAREGAIWENLLTDNDGQYIEAQSGVTLNQAAERSGYHSPFTQLSLRPVYTETKKEYWFPVKNTGGMSDANPVGTLHVNALNDSLKISVSPNVAIDDSLVVTHDGRDIYTTPLHLQPMQLFEKTIPIQGPIASGLRVRVGNDKLVYTGGPENQVERPVIAVPSDQAYVSAERFFRMAEDQNSMRNYDQALSLYLQCLAIEPTHNEALCRVAEYYFRSAEYEKGIGYARKVLAYNTYDAGANYIYGQLLRKLGKSPGAEEALSMATRRIEYRSAALVALAGISLQKQDFDQAADYARQALIYNANNLLAYQFMTTAYRKNKEIKKADSILNVLLEIDPLNHYAHFEQYLLRPGTATLDAFTTAIRNELPHETYLELAITYAEQGMNDEAIKVLEQSPPYPTVFYWLAYLTRTSDAARSKEFLVKAESLSPRFVFPFRLETIPVLTWAQDQHTSWKTTYYLALDYWNNLRADKAKDLFEQLKDTPDYAPFYLARGALFQDDSSRSSYVGRDFARAVQLEPKEWRTWHFQSNHLLNTGAFDAYLRVSKQAYAAFRTNPVVAMDFAKALLFNEQLEECLRVLEKVLILPQEGAQEGHELYELAHLSLALKMLEQKKFRQAIGYLDHSRKWPENLGTGSPYDPDNRLQDFLAAYCEEKLGNGARAADYYNQIKSYSTNHENWKNTRQPANNYIAAVVLSRQGNRQMLDETMTAWKTAQDSLSNWKIAAGSADPQFQWVLAKYNQENEKAASLEKRLLMAGPVTRFRLFLRALQDTSK